MHLHSLHTVSFLISIILLNRFCILCENSKIGILTVFQILQFYLDKVWSLCVIVLFCIVEYKITRLFHVDITICICFHWKAVLENLNDRWWFLERLIQRTTFWKSEPEFAKTDSVTLTLDTKLSFLSLRTCRDFCSARHFITLKNYSYTYAY